MHDEPFGPEDLRLLNLILPHYPDVMDVVRSVRHAVGRVTYPVQSFEQLADALGGVTIAGGSFSIADAQRLLPPYYFPIHSEEDLISKVADLRAQVGSLEALPREEDAALMVPSEQPPENSRPPQIDLPAIPMTAGCAGVKSG